MSGVLTALSLLTAVAIAALLRDRLGTAAALGAALPGVVALASAAGLVLLDLGRLQLGPLGLGLGLAYAAAIAGAVLLRRALPRIDTRVIDRRAALATGLGAALVLTLGAGLRLAPSPYLHGGQDQGIYVNIGHHIARTGRLRPIDRLLRGAVKGVRADHVRALYRIRPVADDSPLSGVREGRWIEGIHIEDAGAGRLIPAFFQLMPVWFAMSELDWGFARSTWPLVLFWALSGLAIFGLATRVASMSGVSPRRASLAGLVAAAALALHPLDLWIAGFPVTENLARAFLLGAAWLALAGADAERGGRAGATLLASLGGLCFAAAAFTRGSFVAHAIALAAALVLAPTGAPRARRALLWSLIAGTTLAVVQAVLHSWPYFFSAAANHFHVPKLQPRQGVAVAWTVAAGVAVLAADLLVAKLRERPRWAARLRTLLRLLTAAMLALALAVLVRDLLAPPEGWSSGQQVLAVLVRHGGVAPLLLGLVALALAIRRASDELLPWLFLAAEVLLATALKGGVRYEFYYARYLVADALPLLLIATAVLWARFGDLAARRGPRVAAAVSAIMLLAWLLPPLRLLPREVYWTRDLADGPEQLTGLLEHVPEDGLLFFDDRAPGRWRGILATPALLTFGRAVLAVRPDNQLVEDALKAGTSVYFVSGGWAEDRQRWPAADSGPWRTDVVARGTYRALRAEIVEGDVPRHMVDWGGPWEVQRVDRSIWRSSGAFSLYPESTFVRAGARELVSEPVTIPPLAGARLELWPMTGNCDVTASLRTSAVDVPLTPLPREGDALLWALPAPPPTTPVQLVIVCTTDAPLAWRWLSVRAP